MWAHSEGAAGERSIKTTINGSRHRLVILTSLTTAVITLLIVFLVSNLQTPEAKVDHRVEHLYGIRDPLFKREMSALLGPTIVGGNRIQPLQNGDEIFPAMLDAIENAKHSINFETYIYWSGRTGTEFARALAERARAGVKVHLMLDWLGSVKMDQSLLAEMKAGGVEVERYHAVRWYSLGKLNNRTHRKVLIVDGLIGFTGGVGIADQWSGHAQDPDHWRDSHFRVEGPVVSQLQAAFLDNWIKTTGRVIHGEEYFPALEAKGTLEMQMFMSSPSAGSESMRLMYLTAITAAESSIDIEAAYFVPDPLMNRELVKALKRGVRLRILVPDKHIDSETVRVASKRAWGPLLENGAQIYEYDPTMLHCKMLIFDGAMVSVGSTNFDMRSFELNDEASLNVYDDAFAIDMTNVFEKDLEAANSYTFEQWRDRPYSQKIAERVLVPIRSQL
jgi:cardiolipin synthase A/B